MFNLALGSCCNASSWISCPSVPRHIYRISGVSSDAGRQLQAKFLRDCESEVEQAGERGLRFRLSNFQGMQSESDSFCIA